MLHSYSFANFRSFRERVEVDLTLAENAPVNGWAVYSPAGPRVSTALAILGANGSGKTSLIQPLAFLNWFVPHSFHAAPDEDIFNTPHFAAEDEPTTFEVIVDAEEPKTLWRYQLSVTKKRILAESVESKSGRGAWHPVFDRRWKEDRYEVIQKDFGLDPVQAIAVRPNVSFVSWAAQYGVPLAKRLSSFLMQTNMDVTGRIPAPADVLEKCARLYAENQPLRDRMRSLLAQWDLGLSDVMIQEFETPNPSDPNGAKQKRWYPYGIHTVAGRKAPYILPFLMESSGTRSAFALLARVLAVLEVGGVIAYDELDSDLHPMMLPPLLELFANAEANPHNAQILFTTHQVEVLRLLQKSQVMLVEKDGVESQAWRLDELEGVRTDDNRVAKYLAGAYGAVPRL